MQIIAISQTIINHEEQNTVNARDLHESLGIKKDFSTWIKPKLSDSMLEENVDFIKVTQKGELSKTGQWRDEYILTLDTAKHIAMMSRGAKAKEIRAYFIEVEKKYRNQTIETPSDIQAIGLMLKTALEPIGQGMLAMAKTQEQMIELMKSQRPTTVQHTTNNISSTQTYITPQREIVQNKLDAIFINAVLDILELNKEGIHQSGLLSKLGRAKDDITARKRLNKFVDIYWVVVPTDGNVIWYKRIEEVV